MRFIGSRAASLSKKMNLNEEIEREKNKLKDMEIQKDFNEKYRTNIIKQDEIFIRRIPYFFWSLGSIAIIFGCYLLYSIIIGPNANEKLFNGLDHGTWWEYLLISIIILLGISFFVAAKYEKVHVSKNTSTLTVYKANLFCSKEKFSIPLSDIKNIFLIKKGTQINSINSVYYRIGIRHEDICISCMTSFWKRTVIIEVMKLRNFIFNSYDTYELIEKDERSNVL